MLYEYAGIFQTVNKNLKSFKYIYTIMAVHKACMTRMKSVI